MTCNIQPGQQSGEAGFTIIELLISLTITGVLLMLMVSGISLVSGSWDRKAVAIEKTENVSRMAALFRRDIENIRRIVIPKNKSMKLLFTGTENLIRFVSIEPPYPTAPGPYFIEYAASANGLLRSRAPYTSKQKDFPETTSQNQVQLIGASFSASFQYGKTQNKTVVWENRWSQQQKLPEFIRLDLNDSNQTNPVKVATLVVALRIDAEQQCINTRSRYCTLKPGIKKKKTPANQQQNIPSTGSGVLQGGGNIPRPSP